MNLLALDTATRTGWAMWQPDASIQYRHRSGVWDCSIRTQPTKHLPADHPGRRFALFAQHVDEAIRVHDIDLIFYEMIVGGPHAGGRAALIEKGLEATLLHYAYAGHFIVPCWPLAAGTIKKWATGSGLLGVTGKQEMVDAAYRAFRDQIFLPHAPTASAPWRWDDNQCDALWLLDLGRALLTEWPLLDREALQNRPLPPEDLTEIAAKLCAHKWKRRKR